MRVDRRLHLVSRTMSASSTCDYHQAVRGILDGRDASLVCGWFAWRESCKPFLSAHASRFWGRGGWAGWRPAGRAGGWRWGGASLKNSREDGLFGQEELEEVEEAREGKTRALPKGPSEEQMRVHRLTHYPFRSWCPQCVAGRAKSWPHFLQEVSDDGGVPTISFWLLLLEGSFRRRKCTRAVWSGKEDEDDDCPRAAFSRVVE